VTLIKVLLTRLLSRYETTFFVSGTGHEVIVGRKPATQSTQHVNWPRIG